MQAPDMLHSFAALALKLKLQRDPQHDLRTQPVCASTAGFSLQATKFDPNDWCGHWTAFTLVRGWTASVQADSSCRNGLYAEVPSRLQVDL
jgi:hypothetical protein